jgi:dipeptidyl aminopeptidase/acylaminoacyl peptidase
VTVLRASAATDPDPAYLSRPRAIRWPTPDGTEAYGLLYLPTNPDFVAPEGGLPPLLVCSHGGPTGRAWTGFNLGYQFWTSRGFAVLDVDYGGSTGYGRPYRNRLRDSWGVVDVDDCCSGAQYLAAQGVVDGSRLAIRGGSAGGYTTLAALAFRDTFAVGASHFGVADPEMLARDTHKFESRYLDRLIGPYPEAAAVYADRSPLRHTEGLNCPIILFQGSDDRVVPPNQAHAMADALRAKGLPVALLEFAGEGHGFRKAETIIRVQEAELSFYGQIFGFAPADPIEPVPIENLPQP